MLPGIVGATLAAQLAAMAVPPLRSLLGLTPLTLTDWALVTGASALPFVLKEIRGQGELDGTSTRQRPAPNRSPSPR